MKKLSLVLFILCLSISSSSVLYSQPYKTGIGARLGTFNGLSVKHFVQEGQAIEGILSTRWNGFIITGLYQFQQEFADVNNLDWFFGGGAHVGFWQSGSKYPQSHGESTSILGLDLIVGVEYTFDEFPFSASLDWKPAFNVIGDTSWWGDGVALSIRYTFR